MVNRNNFIDFDEGISKASISIAWLTVVLLKIMNWNFSRFAIFSLCYIGYFIDRFLTAMQGVVICKVANISLFIKT